MSNAVNDLVKIIHTAGNILVRLLLLILSVMALTGFWFFSDTSETMRLAWAIGFMIYWLGLALSITIRNRK